MLMCQITERDTFHTMFVFSYPKIIKQKHRGGTCVGFLLLLLSVQKYLDLKKTFKKMYGFDYLGKFIDIFCNVFDILL